MADQAHPHVVLVGLSGTGKTSIGRLAAQRLSMPFLDTDAVIEERAGRSVREVFALEGEPRFREYEADVVADVLSAEPPTVVAAGGGAVVTERTRCRLVEPDVFVVWLTAQPAFLASRAAGKVHRPLLDDDPAATMTRLSIERGPWFEAVVDATIDVQPALRDEPKPQAKARLADVVTDMTKLRQAARTGDHIVLVGAMGSGKSTVGKVVASRTGRPYVDSDEVIEKRCGRTAREIAEADGLPALHDVELSVVRDAVADAQPSVIGSAASVVDSSVGRLVLHTARQVVWLRADADVLARRSAHGTYRPHVDPDVVARRAPLYREVATTIIDVDELTAEEVADKALAG